MRSPTDVPQEVEVADDVRGAHVLGDPLAPAEAHPGERGVLVVEGPVLVALVREERHRVEERVQVVLAVEAVQRIRRADAARVEADDVEAPSEVRTQELTEAAEDEGHAGAARSAGVDEQAADPALGVARRHAGQRELGGLAPRPVVVERHLGRCTLEAGEVVTARLPVDRRHARRTAAAPRDSRPRGERREQNHHRDEHRPSGEHGQDSHDAPPGMGPVPSANLPVSDARYKSGCRRRLAHCWRVRRQAARRPRPEPPWRRPRA